jgi:hypothetical protein
MGLSTIQPVRLSGCSVWEYSGVGEIGLYASELLILIDNTVCWYQGTVRKLCLCSILEFLKKFNIILAWNLYLFFYLGALEPGAWVNSYSNAGWDSFLLQIRPEILEIGGTWWLLKLRQRGLKDSRSTYERVLPWLFHWACRAGTRDFWTALAALVGPVQNIFFLAIH